PFVTEALWQRLPGHRDGELLATASWPKRLRNEQSYGEHEFEAVRETVLTVRQLRALNRVSSNQTIDVFVVANPEARPIFVREALTIGWLARANVHVVNPGDAPRTPAAFGALIQKGTNVTLANILVPLAGLVDV